MAKTHGIKHRFATRVWLADQLKERNFDAISEMVKLYNESSELTKAKLLPIVWEFLFPKPRPEDQEGNPEEGTTLALPVTDEQFLKYIDRAKDKA